ncbi:MAG: hypothetical protein ACEY3D_05210 [Rickettsia sp.]|uniref:hypothetical protein n=1 Tax=Rickettsia sp. TaxID=789 RepID=UPI0039794C58
MINILQLSYRGLTGLVAWLSFSSLRESIVAWFNFTSVIPRLDRGFQLKILKLLVFIYCFYGPSGQATG